MNKIRTSGCIAIGSHAIADTLDIVFNKNIFSFPLSLCIDKYGDIYIDGKLKYRTSPEINQLLYEMVTANPLINNNGWN